MIRLLFISFLLTISLCVSAQDFRDGYVILNNKDSITGQVAYRFSFQDSYSCIFRTDKGETKFTPSEILRFGFFNDKRFESIIAPASAKIESPVFAQVVVDGYLSFLRAGQHFFLRNYRNEVYFLPPVTNKRVERPDGTFYREDLTYVGLLNSAVADCKIKVTKETVRYSETAITNLVIKYNNRCHSTNVLYVKEKKEPSKLYYYALAGPEYTLLKSPAGPLPIAPAVGVGFDYSRPRIFDRIFFSGELIYSRQSFQSYESSEVNRLIEHNDQIINQTVIKLPVSLRYQLTNADQSIYFKAGAVYSHPLKSTLKTIKETEGKGLILTEYSEVKVDGYIGFFGAAGLTRPMTGKGKLFAELRLERSKPGNFDCYYATIGLYAGIIF